MSDRKRHLLDEEQSLLSGESPDSDFRDSKRSGDRYSDGDQRLRDLEAGQLLDLSSLNAPDGASSATNGNGNGNGNGVHPPSSASSASGPDAGSVAATATSLGRSGLQNLLDQQQPEAEPQLVILNPPGNPHAEADLANPLAAFSRPVRAFGAFMLLLYIVLFIFYPSSGPFGLALLLPTAFLLQYVPLLFSFSLLYFQSIVFIVFIVFCYNTEYGGCFMCTPS